ncbi:hypothetical protein Har1130_15575 [Haloarcula sp. CBA1130]|uniref:hypothetical protein n=1 Tax=unclassified Haloarcula TaxID=2624677 RepID=UPI001245C54C|nr:MULTISPECIES: hypothetical protein [unclassified Haloarcula]KAA9395877.1 hypothetical protein Har1129_18340 [Haloarcula sp. CBA1129]KAA9400193.1 hypothetical protein Har1130_15575 [Haloarcula sp. CBA1130]
MKTNIRDWLRTLTGGQVDGSEEGLRYFLGGGYNGIYFSLTTQHPLGTNIYEKEWDLLIVLDACRVDALREVAPEFEFINGVDSIWSLGSSSHEWLCKTFTEEYANEISETAYISTNPHTQPTFEEGKRPPRKYITPVTWADWSVVDESQFKLLKQLSRHHRYEDHFDTIPPNVVTDQAISAGRDLEYERMILHYYQPHRPHVASAYRDQRDISDAEDHPWEAIQRGEISKQDAWENYLDNLRLVLGSIRRLLENIDAERVAITADHGELFGEMKQYGHPEGIPHPNLKKVPWAVTSATDRETSTPRVAVTEQEKPSKADVEDRLEHLGYI